MSEEVKTTYGAEEEDPILPSGWAEGDDIFQSESWSGDADPVDGQETDPGTEDDSTEVNTDEDSDLTMEEDGSENSQSAGDDPDGSQPDGDKGDQADTPKTYRFDGLQVNHGKPMDVEMDENELRARIQKSYAFDRQQEQKAKAKFKEVYQEQIDAGLTPAAARMVAQNECGGKSYAIGDDGEIVEDTQTAETNDASTASAEPAAADRTHDLASQIDQVKAIFGDFTEMPEEVAKAVARGADLFTAYTAYRLQESNKAAASLKKENEVLKQNAASAAKAPVRGVTGGGATKQKKESDFLKGFNSEEW